MRKCVIVRVIIFSYSLNAYKKERTEARIQWLMGGQEERVLHALHCIFYLFFSTVVRIPVARARSLDVTQKAFRPVVYEQQFPFRRG